MADYWNSTKYITLPVKFVDGQWELLYGGPTGIADGTYGELRVSLQSIKDKTLRHRLTQTEAVRVLPQGTELLVALSDRSEAGAKLIDHIDGVVHDWIPGCTRYASIHLGDPSDTSRQFDAESGGLWIRQRGVDKTDLVSGQIKLPTHLEEKEPVSSLNHACTLLSRHHERHRISHTMNVYRRVFYREEQGGKSHWYPLDDLRQGVVAEAERHVIAEAWRELESKLGFRPFRGPGQGKRGKES